MPGSDRPGTPTVRSPLLVPTVRPPEESTESGRLGAVRRELDDVSQSKKTSRISVEDRCLIVSSPWSFFRSIDLQTAQTFWFLPVSAWSQHKTPSLFLDKQFCAISKTGISYSIFQSEAASRSLACFGRFVSAAWRHRFRAQVFPSTESSTALRSDGSSALAVVRW